jgi:hypothetical protein
MDGLEKRQRQKSLRHTEPSFLLYSTLDRGEDRLLGLVVRVTIYRPRGPGSISDAARFSEK